MICSRLSSAVAHMSAFGSASSANHGSGRGKGRPNVSPKYPASTLATCLTSPSRFVPAGPSGRRKAYAESPSSFQRRASRPCCRYRCRSAFAPGDMRDSMPSSRTRAKQIGARTVSLVVDVEREFTEFVAARGHALLQVAYALTGDQHAAEDLVQGALA